jgi:hypothetical protein
MKGLWSRISSNEDSSDSNTADVDDTENEYPPEDIEPRTTTATTTTSKKRSVKPPPRIPTRHQYLWTFQYALRLSKSSPWISHLCSSLQLHHILSESFHDFVCLLHASHALPLLKKALALWSEAAVSLTNTSSGFGAGDAETGLRRKAVAALTKDGRVAAWVLRVLDCACVGCCSNVCGGLSGSVASNLVLISSSVSFPLPAVSCYSGGGSGGETLSCSETLVNLARACPRFGESAVVNFVFLMRVLVLVGRSDDLKVNHEQEVRDYFILHIFGFFFKKKTILL